MVRYLPNINCVGDIIMDTNLKEDIQAKLNNTLFSIISNAQHEDNHLYCTIETLLTEGANINAQDEQDNTPLMLALQKGFSGLAQMLIQKKADVNLFNKTGDTPLMWAIVRRLPELAKTIVMQATELDRTNSNGDSALMLAAGEDLTSIVDMLVIRDADMHATNKQNLNAIDSAFNEQYFDTVNYLLSKMSPKSIQDFSSISTEHAEMVEKFKAELEQNSAKLCQIVIPSVLANYGSHFSMFKGFPEIIDHMLFLQTLSSADQFSDWYTLSCLEKNTMMFMNIKKNQIYREERKPTLIFTKTLTETICEGLLQVKKECVSSLFDATRCVATLLNPLNKPAF